jgi:hypothetical protein
MLNYNQQWTTNYNVGVNFTDNRKPTMASQQRFIDDQYNQQLSTTTDNIGLMINLQPTTNEQLTTLG